MKIYYLTFLFFACFSLNAFSQQRVNDPNDYTYHTNGQIHFKIPTTDKQIKSFMKELCWNVGQGNPDKGKDGNYQYIYQRMIYEAAGVNPDKDTEAEGNLKIEAFWKLIEGDCNCDAANFEISFGSILKYAVWVAATDFIWDCISWGVDLNFRADMSADHGRTLLDYVKSQIESNKGDSLESKYQMYYDRLRKHGAKLQAEL
jgi:hypothetical protein